MIISALKALSCRFFAGGFAVFRERVNELEVLMGTKVPSAVTSVTYFIS